MYSGSLEAVSNVEEVGPMKGMLVDIKESIDFKKLKTQVDGEIGEGKDWHSAWKDVLDPSHELISSWSTQDSSIKKLSQPFLYSIGNLNEGIGGALANAKERDELERQLETVLDLMQKYFDDEIKILGVIEGVGEDSEKTLPEIQDVPSQEVLSKSKVALKLALDTINGLDDAMAKRVARGTQEGTDADDGDVWGNCATALKGYLEMALKDEDNNELRDSRMYFSRWIADLTLIIGILKTGKNKEEEQAKLKELVDKIKAKIEGELAK